MMDVPQQPQSNNVKYVTTSAGSQVVYNVSKKLGEGGYNQAYLVLPLNGLGDPCVLKEYLSEKTSNKEVLILKKFNETHPDFPVVKILEPEIMIGEKHGHIESLAFGKQIQDQRPSGRQALQLALRVAEMLRECARMQIAYRDIKPVEHIFWVPGDNDDVAAMTVIDWNIAEFPAAPDALYFDLYTFCRRLPSFFTGKQPGLDQNFEYHPLTWHNFESFNGIFSPKIWLLLADLSMNFAVPVLPEIDQYLVIDHNYSGSQLSYAWDRVILRLKNTLSSFDSPNLIDADNFSGLKGYIDGLQNLFERPDEFEKKRKRFLDDLIFDWPGKSGLSSLDPMINDTILDRLRMARMINPGGFRESLLLSTYVAIYRTGIVRDILSKSVYKKILEGLVDQKPPESYFNADDFVRIIEAAGNKPVEQGLPEMATIHVKLWMNIKDEFLFWIKIGAIREDTPIDTKKTIMESLLSTHPVALLMKNRIKMQRKETEYEKGLVDALEVVPVPNFELAKLHLSYLENNNSSKLDDYHKLITACERVIKIDDDTKNNLEKLQNLADEFADVNFSPNIAKKFEDIKLHLESLKKVEALRKRIKIAELTDLPGLYQQISELMAHELKKEWRERLLIYKINSIQKAKATSFTQQIAVLTDTIVNYKNIANIASDVGELDVANQIGLDIEKIEFKVTELQNSLVKGQNTIRETYKKMVEQAGADPEQYIKIGQYLHDAKNNIQIADEKILDWIQEEQTKNGKFLNAATKLQGLERSILPVDFDQILAEITEYPGSEELVEGIKKIKSETVFRKKILAEIAEMKRALEISKNNSSVLTATMETIAGQFPKQVNPDEIVSQLKTIIDDAIQASKKDFEEIVSKQFEENINKKSVAVPVNNSSAGTIAQQHTNQAVVQKTDNQKKTSSGKNTALIYIGLTIVLASLIVTGLVVYSWYTSENPPQMVAAAVTPSITAILPPPGHTEVAPPPAITPATDSPTVAPVASDGQNSTPESISPEPITPEPTASPEVSINFAPNAYFYSDTLGSETSKDWFNVSSAPYEIKATLLETGTYGEYVKVVFHLQVSVNGIKEGAVSKSEALYLPGDIDANGTPVKASRGKVFAPTMKVQVTDQIIGKFQEVIYTGWIKSDYVLTPTPTAMPTK